MTITITTDYDYSHRFGDLVSRLNLVAKTPT